MAGTIPRAKQHNSAKERLSDMSVGLTDGGKSIVELHVGWGLYGSPEDMVEEALIVLQRKHKQIGVLKPALDACREEAETGRFEVKVELPGALELAARGGQSRFVLTESAWAALASIARDAARTGPEVYVEGLMKSFFAFFELLALGRADRAPCSDLGRGIFVSIHTGYSIFHQRSGEQTTILLVKPRSNELDYDY